MVQCGIWISFLRIVSRSSYVRGGGGDRVVLRIAAANPDVRHANDWERRNHRPTDDNHSRKQTDAELQKLHAQSSRKHCVLEAFSSTFRRIFNKNYHPTAQRTLSRYYAHEFFYQVCEKQQERLELDSGQHLPMELPWHKLSINSIKFIWRTPVAVYHNENHEN